MPGRLIIQKKNSLGSLNYEKWIALTFETTTTTTTTTTTLCRRLENIGVVTWEYLCINYRWKHFSMPF